MSQRIKVAAALKNGPVGELVDVSAPGTVWTVNDALTDAPPIGLGQIEGALVAAILIGLARSFTVYLFPEMEVLVPFLIMVLVLLFRPQGLFSVAQTRRV